MPAKLTARTDVHDFSALHLTADTFAPIYSAVVGLRFPTDVARVLELRYLINHAVDSFPEPAPTSDYREFRDALQAVIDATGIDNKRHSERLLRILCMMRELHYLYSVNRRDAENQIRERIADNRRRRRRAVRRASGFVLAAVLGGILWVSLGEPGWTVKILTALLAVGAWVDVRTLPHLDRALRTLEKRLSRLEQHRVKSIHWRMLVQKLALLLGFKRNSEIEVFVLDTDHHDYPPSSQMHH